MNGLFYSPLLLSINLMIASAVACTALWYYSRPYQGPGVWTIGVLLLASGLLLLIIESPLPNIVGSALQIAGEAVIVMGLFRFLGLSSPWWIVPTSAGLVCAMRTWHWWVAPFNSELLVAFHSIISALLAGLASHTLWSGSSEPELKGVRRFVALTFLGYCVVTTISGFVALVTSFKGVEYADETHSVSSLLPINFGVPLWVAALVGMALLTLRRALLDSQRHAREAKSNSNRFERLMSVTNGGVMLLKEGRIHDANPMLAELYARPLSELIGQPLADFFEAGDDLLVQLSVADSQPHDLLALRGDGSKFDAELSVAALDDGSRVAEIRDVSVRKALEEELRLLAFRDPLTGALNRRAFAERAEQELLRSSRNSTPTCLAIFDLDYFKRINDSYGHAIGDQVLQRFSHLCHKRIRRTDLFARFGGEEFVLLMPDTEQNQANALLNHLREHWADERLDSPQGVLHSTVSIGLVQIDSTYLMEYWLERADTALYQAKSTGRNRVILG
ncbi:sensor domain-containing diguanylate cyclase [Pseudomonas sp. BLCC-B13]|jgi:diguanylate cyclase (GGDEF)-like protein|uniref:GGDEF domain-containing protein n=1 Tax=Pseudomonas sp. BLCC-B13 TaxID=3025314 RepID=UPI00234E4B15|nr:sensor domain-containing diguanylate cyclase [Pseudomonas sp. BLCC-B13]MDC7827403.1 sensor domain-containing diguanylate cyclase [Pseudomonas sp. BLCC-B13]